MKPYFILPTVCIWLLSSFVLFSTPWIAPEKASLNKNPLIASEKSIGLGKKLFASYCVSCHGAEGLGNGPMARTLSPKPASLVDSLVQKQTDGALFWKISEGRGAMPAHKNCLTTEQRWCLVIYLRNFKR